MISTSLQVAAAPAVVHDLLIDIGAWKSWSPHVAWVKPRHGHVAAGDVVLTRAFFSPVPTPMHVDEVLAEGGMRWHSRAFGLRLRYDNLVEPAPGGARITFNATLEGRGAALVELLARPFSARGQRRRMARLGRLAALVEDERRRA